MKIWIGCDHAGYERKQEVIALLKERQWRTVAVTEREPIIR